MTFLVDDSPQALYWGQKVLDFQFHLHALPEAKEVHHQQERENRRLVTEFFARVIVLSFPQV